MTSTSPHRTRSAQFVYTFCRRATGLALYALAIAFLLCLVLLANTARGATLSVPQAKHAIRVTLASASHPTSLAVRGCRRRSPWAIRCVAIEEQVTMPTEATGIGTIELFEGHVTVRLQHHRSPDYNYLHVVSS